MRVLIVAFLAALFGVVSEASADNAAVWAALAQGGKVIILRHASAPGPSQGREGDPPGFELDDCTTQRNLSTSGRKQAYQLGEMLRAHNVVVTRVLTSPWCRAKETADLMNLGPVPEQTNLLHNIGEHTGGAGAALKEMPDAKRSVNQVRTIIRNWHGPGNMVMVSHGRTLVHVLYRDNRHSPEQAGMYILQPTPDGQDPFIIVGSLSAP
jgi:phosphohistidine phosphatase SixA